MSMWEGSQSNPGCYGTSQFLINFSSSQITCDSFRDTFLTFVCNIFWCLVSGVVHRQKEICIRTAKNRRKKRQLFGEVPK